MSLFLMMRPINIFIGIISVYISSILLGITIFNLDILHIVVVVSGTIAISNLINDILDIKTDKINRPKKQKVLNKIKISKVIYMIIILFIAIQFSLYNLNNISKDYFHFIILPIIVTYTPIFKSIPLIGNILIGFTLGSVFLFTEISLTKNLDLLCVPALLATYLTILRELIKDIEDYSGDLLNGINTFPVYFGIKASLRLYLILSILLLFWGGIVLTYNNQNFYYLLFFWILFTPWIFTTWFYIFYLKSNDYGKISLILKVATIFGLIVITSLKL
tara:strand:- start:286 stop:1113 length:828 start_codon:yes stop_codon:yes gene_type:complete